MTFGEKLIELRKKENFTQEKLAEKIGVSRQTLSNWESNITTPDVNQAKEIAKIFNVSLDDLTNIKTEVECKEIKSVLTNLINKECYLDIESNDYRLTYLTLCKVIDVYDNFIKIEFKYKKNTIIKLLDKKLITSIKVILKDGEV